MWTPDVFKCKRQNDKCNRRKYEEYLGFLGWEKN